MSTNIAPEVRLTIPTPIRVLNYISKLWYDLRWNDMYLKCEREGFDINIPVRFKYFAD